MWGVLSCLPAQPPGGHWERRGLDTGKDKLDKNSTQSRTFERAGTPPPPRSPRQATCALPSAPPCSRNAALSRREKGPAGQASNPWSLRLYFQSLPESREFEGKGSAPAKSDLSAAGPSQRPRKQEPHLALTSSQGPVMRTQGPPDGLTQHRQLKSRQLDDWLASFRAGAPICVSRKPSLRAEG